jgi:universal stress protein E
MRFKDILVDVDAIAARHPALDQALDLARRANGRLTLVDVVPDVPRLARPYLSERLEAEIVRSHMRDRAVRTAPFGAVDMRLLRECPCPVWLLGGLSGRRPRRIVAAVHPDREDAVGMALNRRIVEAGREVADLEHGSLTLVTAWSTFGEGLLKTRVSRTELGAFVRTARGAAAAEMDALIEAVGPLGRRCRVELVRGEPETAIPRFVARHRTDLVVMGTVARSGLRGLIIGNTAEHVLGRLRCNVLALKPEGFVSPVPRPDGRS